MLDAMLLVAMGNATILFCAREWGIIGWYQVYRKSWMPKGDCYLCMSFWLAFVILAFVGLIVGKWYLIGLALPAAAVTTFVFKNLFEVR